MFSFQASRQFHHIQNTSPRFTAQDKSQHSKLELLGINCMTDKVDFCAIAIARHFMQGTIEVQPGSILLGVANDYILFLFYQLDD